MIDRPVLEVASIPPGAVLASVDGQWIEQIIRLTNGVVLIELPAN